MTNLNCTKTREEIKKDNEEEIADFLRKNEGYRKFLNRVSDRYRLLFTRVYSGNKSRANAIKAKCLECVEEQREEVKHCTAKSCPLWHLRPYQG